MVFNGHASPTVITIHDPPQEYLRNTDIYNSGIVSNYLSDVDIVIFAGCSTAGTVSGGYNLPKSAELAGAKVAIGWNAEPTGNTSNQWINYFFGLMNTIDSSTGNYYTAYNAWNKTNQNFTGTAAAQARIYGTNINLQFDDILRRES